MKTNPLLAKLRYHVTGAIERGEAEPITAIEPAPRIKTASDLKHYVENAGRCPHFFARSSMRFFGDTMRNYGLRQPRPVQTQGGETVRAYELTRRRPVRHGLHCSAWFDAATFERVFPADNLNP